MCDHIIPERVPVGNLKENDDIRQNDCVKDSDVVVARLRKASEQSGREISLLFSQKCAILYGYKPQLNNS
jgi:hypothetical protein